ncbi:hydantoinase B/oxoprolinase family protein [Oculatella sp. FACHB-28]|uniref:hydantoinase B/oxoprolinase family protein n=1 Tax=Oculatella sp. FACHB-28 TaxID=2692845 RepID=UPI0016845FF9|nr:hydantoinase B/oxoprolinase family protein [Oculatella sp. FACHB-28]MBD2057846.1 hydantoinase B/oxoprolinase family protein [Oculatella sp. FACHB-28]
MLKVFADRGGTFTDLVAVTDDEAIARHLSHSPERFQVVSLPDHQWVIVYKLLSENPERYQDAVIQGIRDILGIASDEPIPSGAVEVVKMGTTVATNALLERKGDRTLLLITKGFRDALKIGYQNRPNIFARHIVLPEMVYEQVIEAEERYTAQGEELIAISPEEIARLTQALQVAFENGIRACAIVFLHGYRYPKHEQQVMAIAQQIGFTQISVSHEVSPLMKLVSRGDTTVVDAYLSPILRRYVEQVAANLTKTETHSTKLEFMKSDGGLTDARLFQGKDSILSGPAGGIVGAVKTSTAAGFNQIIGFDMGGTSTDVSHFNGEYERTFETEVAGVRLRAPMMSIHTVAAGGGSILFFDGSRYRVGPESAGANPGPACYRKGGPLAVTDCNVMLGKIQLEFFPHVFGETGNLPLDNAIVQQKFAELSAEIHSKTGDSRTSEQVAAGFLAIAIDKMANAIKKISVQRGYDVTEYTLCCFGGAGGQHACLIAEALGMTQIFIHPYAGVLSAYGIGLADLRTLKEKAAEVRLTPDTIPTLKQMLEELSAEAQQEILAQGVSGDRIQTLLKTHLRYEGTDSALIIDFGDADTTRTHFEQSYHQRYGFTMPHKALIVEAVSVEAIGRTTPLTEPLLPTGRTTPLNPIATVQMYTHDTWHDTPVYQREDLKPGDRLPGPSLIIEPTGTNVIEPGWSAELTQRNHLVLTQTKSKEQRTKDEPLLISQPSTSSKPDPVLLEIFNNLFRAIAEEMGITLQNTSYSVNIKERLDFSCAIFDQHGQLVANAPHIPVHLGSMSESVSSLIQAKSDVLKSGDVYVSNNPYNGGTHLPDITVITPVFATIATSHPSTPLFYVASRGHHADIGGITPGSMPPHSTSMEQEGVLIDNFQLVNQGEFCESKLVDLLTSGEYPVRNVSQNIADLQAQVAANERGSQELLRMVEHYGLETVRAYMQHVQNNAEESVRRVIDVLQDGQFVYPMDDDCEICVKITINRGDRSAHVDFTGTSPQQQSNLNAPLAICKAVVLYVFRTLVEDDIPLNAGCLKPLEITIPDGCMLNPHYPAAVVAGNVETSQAIANSLYGALGVMAAAQGTMNNFTFGNEQHQYYETICGGSGAGATFDGTDAVQTHMTNSRLTDPEVLEWRFPVLLEEFAIRHNSGGKGHHSGGNGVIRRIRFRETMTAAILSGHRIIPPFGLQGGEPGAIGRNFVERKDGAIASLPGKAEVQVHSGDLFVIETPGGGGFGA